MVRVVDVDDLVARARRGEHRAVGRLLSLVESGSADGRALREVAAALAPYAGRAHVVGLTGPPGVGKSTSTSALITALRRGGRRVGVLAVDPSSPFSGGALLGDRVRMGAHATDDGVFIRSVASRGHLGGLAWSTPQALRVLDAAGCDVVLIETVGVGQSEIEVVALTDTTVVLLAPGAGDAVQATKAGILEVADVFAVNKADRDGAARTVRELEQAVGMAAEVTPSGWVRPVVSTVAVRDGGVDDLVAALDAHRGWLDRSGERARRRRARAEAEISAIAVERVRRRTVEMRVTGVLADRVVAGELDPYRAADELLGAAGLGRGSPGPDPETADSSGADSSGADSSGADSSGADSSGADSSGADAESPGPTSGGPVSGGPAGAASTGSGAGGAGGR